MGLVCPLHVQLRAGVGFRDNCLAKHSKDSIMFRSILKRLKRVIDRIRKTQEMRELFEDLNLETSDKELGLVQDQPQRRLRRIKVLQLIIKLVGAAS